MYTDYFGFREKPFTIAPDPRYLYMSEHHREALAHLLYGISSDGCLILLTGDVGTGKTTVCRSLLEQLPENTETAIIVNPKLSVQELLETICEELEIAFEKSSTSVKSYIDGINRHLLNSHTQGKTTVLIIDEAQNLDMEVLEQLRLLTNLETNTAKLLKIVLIGQTELQEKLKSPKVAQINQRITSRYHLAPLNKSDAASFIQHRLIVAGGGRMQFFTEQALHRAYQLSNGIPRLINILCDRALLGAYVEEKSQVTEEIMWKAGQEVLGKIPLPPQQTPSKPTVKVALLTLFLFTIATTVYFLVAYEFNPLQLFINRDKSVLEWKNPDAPSTPEQDNQEQANGNERSGVPGKAPEPPFSQPNNDG